MLKPMILTLAGGMAAAASVTAVPIPRRRRIAVSGAGRSHAPSSRSPRVLVRSMRLP